MLWRVSVSQLSSHRHSLASVLLPLPRPLVAAQQVEYREHLIPESRGGQVPRSEGATSTSRERYRVRVSVCVPRGSTASYVRASASQVAVAPNRSIQCHKNAGRHDGTDETRIHTRGLEAWLGPPVLELCSSTLENCSSHRDIRIDMGFLGSCLMNHTCAPRRCSRRRDWIADYLGHFGRGQCAEMGVWLLVVYDRWLSVRRPSHF